MLKMPDVKLKLNSKTNFKVSKAALLSKKILVVGLRLLRYFPAIGNFYAQWRGKICPRIRMHWSLVMVLWRKLWHETYSQKLVAEKKQNKLPQLQSIVAYSRQGRQLVVFQKSILVPDTNFTEPTDWSSMLMAPDLIWSFGWRLSVKLLSFTR